MKRRHRLGVGVFAVLGGLCAASLVSGCVTETRASAPDRERVRTSRPAKPAGVRPEQMMLSAGVAKDSDGNGYPDTIPVVVYLFGDTRRYALPVQERGTFEFHLIGPEGEVLGHWIFPEEEAARAVGDSAAGVCYRFGLLMSPGRDRMSSRPASLRASFTISSTGERVLSPGAATIRVGSGG